MAIHPPRATVGRGGYIAPGANTTPVVLLPAAAPVPTPRPLPQNAIGRETAPTERDRILAESISGIGSGGAGAGGKIPSIKVNSGLGVGAPSLPGRDPVDVAAEGPDTKAVFIKDTGAVPDPFKSSLPDLLGGVGGIGALEPGPVGPGLGPFADRLRQELAMISASFKKQAMNSPGRR